MIKQNLDSIIDDIIADGLILHAKIKGHFPADNYSPIRAQGVQRVQAHYLSLLPEKCVKRVGLDKRQIDNIDGYNQALIDIERRMRDA